MPLSEKPRRVVSEGIVVSEAVVVSDMVGPFRGRSGILREQPDVEAKDSGEKISKACGHSIGMNGEIV
jgi:hypothetical protein